MAEKVVFITGGTGFVGRILIKKLKEKGFYIIALVRRSSDLSAIEKFVDKEVVGDIQDKDSFENYLENVDVVYHLAGVVTDWAPKRRYYDVHVKGTRNILEVVRKHNVKSFVHLSTIDVFAHESFGVVNEDSPFTDSKVPYRQTKLEAHKLVFDELHKKNMNIFILCPTWVYGDGDRIFVSEIIKQLKKRQFVFIGDKNNSLPMVHVDNLSSILVELAIDNDYKSGTFIVSDVNTTWAHLVKIICDNIGVEYPRITIPFNIAYFLGYLMEVCAHLTKSKTRPLLTRTAVETVGKSINVDILHLREVIKYQSKSDFDIRIVEAINSLKTESVS